MSPHIPQGQFIGGLVGVAFLLFVGVWCLYIWPRAVHRQIERGELDEYDGQAKLKKAPFLGYLFMLLAIGDLVFHSNGWINLRSFTV